MPFKTNSTSKAIHASGSQLGNLLGNFMYLVLILAAPSLDDTAGIVLLLSDLQVYTGCYQDNCFHV
jgi:hypothetical protein